MDAGNNNHVDAISSEFLTEEFDIHVSEEEIQQLATEVEDIVRALRSQITSDDTLEDFLRETSSSRILQSKDTVEQEDPEPFTKRMIIDTLFEVLGYPDLSVEVGDFSSEYGMQADYSASLRGYDEIESQRLLVEAEPVNKELNQEKHGLGQVRDWLEKDKFEANFGIATDGIRWILIRYDRESYNFDTIAEINLKPVFYAVFQDLTSRQGGIEEWLGEHESVILEELLRAVKWENFLVIAGKARNLIREKRKAITDDFYDDYVRYVFGVEEGTNGRTQRSLIGDGIIPPEHASGNDIRLFAVELMNRLIFVKFLEDKGLVNGSLLDNLLEAHSAGVNPNSFYKTYLEPLFFGVLDERPSNRSERIRQIQLYEDIPYLDGGLFRPTSSSDTRINDRDFDVGDSVLESIINLLESYSFSADGGPGDLDPSILGNVFEKTINYLTTDSGDQQKELGAYYTPDEITSFCARETVRPALLDRLSNKMVEEWGWTPEMANYENIYDFIDALPDTNTHVIESLLEEVDHFRVLDPACGSGHFLTSVQSEIVAIRKALYDKHDEDPGNWELVKQTVVQNIYGVDIVQPAVEIAKLRLWLSIIVEVDPLGAVEYDEDDLALPNVVYNVRQGNSLIGFTELMETTDDGNQARLGAWGPDSVREKYGDIIDLVDKHKRADSTEEAISHLQEAESLLSQYRQDLNEKELEEFREAGIKDITLEEIEEYHPFHWVLEFATVYADGGFDVVVGNPPWDKVKVTRDDFFTRYEPEFISLPTKQKSELQKELLEDDNIVRDWEDYQKRAERQGAFFRNNFENQTSEVNGRTVSGDTDLAPLFLERSRHLVREDGFVSLIVPNIIFTGGSYKDLRTSLVRDAELRSLFTFENHGIFPAIDSRYTFTTVTFEAVGSTEELLTGFRQGELSILREPSESGLKTPANILLEFSPESRMFPKIRSQEHVDILIKITNHPSLDQEWDLDLYRELDQTNDADRFFEENAPDRYPLYGGRNIFQFAYSPPYAQDVEYYSVPEDQTEVSAKRRIREKGLRRLKNAIYEFIDPPSSKTKIGAVNDYLERIRDRGLEIEDVRNDCTEYRIAYRDIARSTDERTAIAAVLPKGVVTYTNLTTVRPFKIIPEEEALSDFPVHDIYQNKYTEKELFVLLGIINSLPFDFLIREKTDKRIATYSMLEAQAPSLEPDEPWFDFISKRSARLNCYGEEFAEMRERLGSIDPVTDADERKQLHTEIDAAVFKAYDLAEKEVQFVLDQFHRVKDPRIMDDEYFDLVMEAYRDEMGEGLVVD